MVERLIQNPRYYALRERLTTGPKITDPDAELVTLEGLNRGILEAVQGISLDVVLDAENIDVDVEIDLEGEYSETEPTLTDGQKSRFQLTPGGRLKTFDEETHRLLQALELDGDIGIEAKHNSALPTLNPGETGSLQLTSDSQLVVSDKTTHQILQSLNLNATGEHSLIPPSLSAGETSPLQLTNKGELIVKDVAVADALVNFEFDGELKGVHNQTLPTVLDGEEGSLQLTSDSQLVVSDKMTHQLLAALEVDLNGEYNSSPPSLSNGQKAKLQLTQDGLLKVQTLATGAGAVHAEDSTTAVNSWGGITIDRRGESSIFHVASLLIKNESQTQTLEWTLRGSNLDSPGSVMGSDYFEIEEVSTVGPGETLHLTLDVHARDLALYIKRAGGSDVEAYIALTGS